MARTAANPAPAADVQDDTQTHALLAESAERIGRLEKRVASLEQMTGLRNPKPSSDAQTELDV